MIKACGKCGETQALAAFGPDKRRRDGRQSYCRDCCSLYESTPARLASKAARQRKTSATEAGKNYQANYQRRPEARDSRVTREKFRRYKLTDGDFAKLLSDQHGRCAICDTDTPRGKYNALQIDHDHVTGKVRGLLCMNCNTLLGHARDSIEVLSSAIRYLNANLKG